MTRRQKEAVLGLTVVAFILVSGIHLLLGSHNYADIQMTINGRSLHFEVPQILVDQIVYTLIALLVAWLVITKGVNLLAKTTITLIATALLALAVWLLYYLDPAQLLSYVISLGLATKNLFYWLAIGLMAVVVLGSIWYTIKHRWLEAPSDPSSRS